MEKIFNKKIISLFLLVFLSTFAFGQELVKLTDEASIDKVIKAMTLEEKAKFVTGMGMNASKRVPGTAGNTYEIKRLGIPEIVVSDGPAGLRIGGITGGKETYATAFPIPAALASTWDLDLINKVGVAMGKESKAFGVDILLGPAFNIKRDPLNGRNFEYFTEDPYLNGRLALAITNGIQSQGVGVSLKHYAVNNQETNRMNINEVVSERALREIYLSAFEYVVKNGNPWTIMSAYPSVNGEFASQNKYLLTDILRNEWGFNGFVMSDWFAVKDVSKALNAGNDLIMPGGAKWGTSGETADDVLEALKNGKIKEEDIDKNIKSILKIVLKSLSFKGNVPSNSPNLKENVEIVRQSAAEGMVLLKNEDKTMPFDTSKKVALFGKNAFDYVTGGGGSSQVNAAYRVQLLEGLTNTGYKVISENNGVKFAEGIKDSDLEIAVKNSDIAVISIGRNSTEGNDNFTMETTKEETDLIKKVSEAYHKMGKKVVVLLNIGAPIETEDWKDYADSILVTWQPGQEAGNAVADVISGKVNPSGKLTETFPVRYKDVPSYGNFPGTKTTVYYGEGIYVGYRYYDTKDLKVQYPFGFGMSYTTFKYSNLKVDKNSLDVTKNDKIKVTVDITNTGKIKGKETVQLYITQNISSIDRPEKELKGFGKVELAPNETKTVTMYIEKRDLSYYDVNVKDWVAEAGKYTIKVGASSRDIKLTTEIKAIGNTDKYLVTENSSWSKLQENKNISKIVAKYIGYNAVVEAVWFGDKTFGKFLTEQYEKNTELKGNVEKQNKLTKEIIDEINKMYN